MLPPHPATAPNQTPSRRLRWFARVARTSLALLLAFWLLVGISWGLIHVWIVPGISDFRPRLEAAASQALGVPVSIGQVSAKSNGLNPSFEFQEITLRDTAGRPALRLPHVVVGLSPLAISGWGVAQLVVDGAELDIRRHADGRIEIAGLPLAQASNQNRSALADWALAQPELVLRGGQLRWTDEMRAAPPLLLTHVEAVLRNSGKQHHMRLDATPPSTWGERFSLRASLREPFSLGLTGQRQMPWENGTGELFADFSRTDVAELRPYLEMLQLGAEVASGHGALRLWAALNSGQVSSATADMALTGVRAQLSQDVPPLMLASVSGRLSAKLLANGFEVRSDALRFETDDKLVWPDSTLSLVHIGAESLQPSRTELNADTLDLAALTALATRLPLGMPPALRNALLSLAPQGRVAPLSARWQGPAEQAVALHARGKVRGLTVAPGMASLNAQAARPGVEQLDFDFDITPQGGQAKLTMQDGAVSLPGVLAQARVEVAQLSGQLRWKTPDNRGDSEVNKSYLARISQLNLSDLRLANADLAGRAELGWQPPAADEPGPGTLDLQASLSRGRASAVHRYLPQVLPLDLRQYLAAALLGGELADVKLALKGDLQHFPFADPRRGNLQLSARLRQLRLDYVPPALGALTASADTDADTGTTKRWPQLEALDGELLIQRNSLELRQLKGRAQALPGLQLQRGQLRIADLAAPVLDITLQVNGPLAQGLQYVNQSPVSAMLSDALLGASATGPADFNMRMSLPLDSTPTRFQANLVLPGNDVRPRPEAPMLGQLRGSLRMTENSLRVDSAQARVLGGDLLFEGGLAANANQNLAGPLMQFRGQGTLTAEGLQQASELGTVAQLMRNASGSAAYAAVLSVRRGEVELQLNSPLTGLTLNLPPPLNKTAAESWPLHIERSLLTGSINSASSGNSPNSLQDQLLLTLGDRAQLRYVRALNSLSVGSVGSAQQPTARVLRGSVALGLPAGESVALPAQGVAAKLQLGQADLDAWQSLLSPGSASAPAGPALQAYLPTQLALRAKSLTYQGYSLNELTLDATRDGPNWSTRIDARELGGYAHISQGSTANGDRLYARLSRLNLAHNLARNVEALLDPVGSLPVATANPASLASPARQAVPALDIVVDDFELNGRKLGRLEVDAVNRPLPARDGNPREWRLNRLLLSSPQGVLSASGSWAVAATLPTSTAGLARDARRMALDFKLDVADAGGLLKRLDMDGLVRLGQGQLAGQLHWTGSPLALHYPSLGGQFRVQIERGQFLKADPGIAKLLGVLSLQSLPRRLTLDFRDVFSEGFAFDVLSGDVRIQQGLASTRNLQMKGVNAAVMMEGSADIARETQQLQVLVVPEVNAGTASLLASLANPVMGVGTFLAQLFLRGSINSAATQAFNVDGPWSEPRITRVERQAAPLTNKP